MIRRGALLLALLSSLSAPAYAGDDEQDQQGGEKTLADMALEALEREQQESALERNGQPGVDPWSVSSPSALFTRPSFREAVKVSLETQDAFGISLVPGEASNAGRWWLRAFRVSAGWNQGDRVASGGLAWSVSLRDARLISVADLAEIDPPFAELEAQCRAEGKSVKSCGEYYQDMINDAPIRYWWPAFSLGGSIEYDHVNRQRGGAKVNASIDVQGEYGIAITANGDFISEPVENMAGIYTRRAGGGLALSVRPSWAWLPQWEWLREKSIVMAGTKYLSCLRPCMDQKSPWELNVVAGYEIKKGTLFGVSVVWKDEDLRDRALVLNLSTSFGTLE